MSNITIKDIARICGVSVSTVSRALNGSFDINKATRERIMEVVEKNGYRSNISARNLRLTDSHTIALLIKGIANPFFSRMIQVFEEETKIRGYQLIVQHVREDRDEADEAIKLIGERKINGLIFLGGYINHVQSRLEKIDIPFVLSTIAIEDEKTALNYNQVSVDDNKEASRIVEYLISAGHRRIAILAADDMDDSVGKLRLRGYGNALKKYGIPIDPMLITSMENADNVYTYENGYRSTLKLLKETRDFTAIFAISDTLAIGAVKALSDNGIKVPEDVSVVGFDGLDITRYYNPTITSLKQPVEEIARATVNTLFENMQNPEMSKKRIFFEGSIYEGNSVKKLF
ncbi:MAG: LacI family DNA-binding transcriptional regulator [Eubacteriales bacterium]|nr:LacI family DNA-binding transcriptional regulator [Eubacteriales bacterium]